MNKVLLLTSGPIISAILGFITVPILTWVYDVTLIGELSFIQALSGFIVTICTFATHQAYVREYNESFDKIALFKNIVVPSITVFFLIFLMLIAFYLNGINYVEKWHFLIFIISFTSCMLIYVNHFYRMEGQITIFFVSQVLPRTIFLFLVLVGLLTERKSELLFLVVLFLISQSTSLLILISCSFKNFREILRKKIDLELLARIMKFSSPLIIVDLSLWGLMSLDKIFLKILSDSSQLGIYSVSSTISGVLLVLNTALLTVFYPYVYKNYNEDFFLIEYNKIRNSILCAILIIFFSSCFLSPLLLFLLPEAYSDIIYIFPLTILSPLLLILSETFSIGIGIKKKSSLLMFAAIISILVNLLLSYILVPSFGAVGAAISTTISFFIYFALRCQISNWFWKDFSNNKIYILIFIIIIMHSAFSILRIEIKSLYIFNFILFLILSSLSLKEFKIAFCYVLNRVGEKKC